MHKIIILSLIISPLIVDSILEGEANPERLFVITALNLIVTIILITLFSMLKAFLGA